MLLPSLKPVPGPTCPSYRHHCVSATLLIPDKNGCPQLSPMSPMSHSSGNPKCTISFHRGMRGTLVSTASPTQLSSAPRLKFIPYGGSRLSGQPLYPYRLCSQPAWHWAYSKLLDVLTEQESAYCHPQHSFFPFCKTAACLEVYAIFRASPIWLSLRHQNLLLLELFGLFVFVLISYYGKSSYTRPQKAGSLEILRVL